MTIVFGKSIEPGGMVLDDETYVDKCPECGADAMFRRYETCDSGAINQCTSVNCSRCGYHECEAEVCEICESQHGCYSPEEEADHYLDVVCEVSNLTEALVLLSKVEGSLLSAKAMLGFGESSSARSLIREGMFDYSAFLHSSLPKTDLLISLVTTLSPLAREMAPALDGFDKNIH